MTSVAIVGGGPAGLMAAESLMQSGVAVTVYDAMPSVGRKFLQAGKGGLNLTHAEPLSSFVARYSPATETIARQLSCLDAQGVRDWAAGLGVDTFVGSSGRVFPLDMKAAPLLRAWLHRLRSAGVRIAVHHRWLGWTTEGALRFQTRAGEVLVKADAVILALGGASWPHLGSDGQWVSLLRHQGVGVADWLPANVGFDADWDAGVMTSHAGQPLKPVEACVQQADGQWLCRQGELVITASGVEGSLVYALSQPLRDAWLRDGRAQLRLNLLPGRSLAEVQAALHRPQGSQSMSNHLRRVLGITGVKAALLRALTDKSVWQDKAALSQALVSLSLPLLGPRPLAEAISSAGGVVWSALDDRLMLKQRPGVFCAGEMLDWEAPTGGYLLTLCLAQGKVAAQGALAWLAEGGHGQ